MLRFLNKLFRDFRTTSTARSGRRPSRRAPLQMEALEDRLVPTVSLQGPDLSLFNLPKNQTIAFSCSPTNGNEMVVQDGNTVLFQGNKQAITSVHITLEGGDTVKVDDSNGMPFGQAGGKPGTLITLDGSGANNLTLLGSRSIAGNEAYVAGAENSSEPGSISVDNLVFALHSAIASVDDLLPITGNLDIQTIGSQVGLSNGSIIDNDQVQTLGGMGVGGGDTLSYASKSTITLEDFAPNATVSLNATAPAASEQVFAVNMHGTGDKTVIANTPGQVSTQVFANVAPVADQASVSVQADTGPVTVSGNKTSTSVSVGQLLIDGLFSTHGIQANVTVNGASSLFLSDSGNDAASPENVKVTEKTISGTGLFGNNNATLSYSNVVALNLVSGQYEDAYTVIASQPGATFSSKISITDFASSFSTNVTVDSGSHLQLTMDNITKHQAALVVHPVNGTAVLEPGVVDVFFAGVLSSQVFFSSGFNVTL